MRPYNDVRVCVRKKERHSDPPLHSIVWYERRSQMLAAISMRLVGLCAKQHLHLTRMFWIAKIAVPKLCADVINMALQVHEASGVSQGTILAQAYANARAFRHGDGSDEVHTTTIANQELGKGCQVY